MTIMILTKIIYGNGILRYNKKKKWINNTKVTE